MGWCSHQVGKKRPSRQVEKKNLKQKAAELPLCCPIDSSYEALKTLRPSPSSSSSSCKYALDQNEVYGGLKTVEHLPKIENKKITQCNRTEK